MTSRDPLAEMFDSVQFRNSGHTLVDLLAEYLQQNLQGESKVLDWQSPNAALQHWRQPLPTHPTLNAATLLQKLGHDVLGASLHIHHPRNLGHQVAPPLPMAALCDLVAALTNQAMAVYETGPSATLLERQVLHWLGELVGWENCEGVLTSGGAQANLTALLAARQVQAGGIKAGWNAWQSGVAAGPPLCMLTSTHAHYSVSRAAGIMGLGTQAVIQVAADNHGRMQMSALRQAWQQCMEAGRRPFVVIATAGCTPTGSIDPLPEIGAFCREKGLWLHVDGAHGASALLSAAHREALHGIALADSVVWDGHKLLYMPATVSAVLFRQPQHSYAAFAQEASYLFQGNSEAEEAFNTSYRTLECTKRMMGLKLWAAFSLYGVERLGSLVERVYATASLLAQKIEAAADFELLMPPQTNIVCFHHRPHGLLGEALNAHQAKLRQAIVQSGAFHLTQVRLEDGLWLRATVMNPLTSEADLDALLSGLRTLA